MALPEQAQLIEFKTINTTIALPLGSFYILGNTIVNIYTDKQVASFTPEEVEKVRAFLSKHKV